MEAQLFCASFLYLWYNGNTVTLCFLFIFMVYYLLEEKHNKGEIKNMLGRKFGKLTVDKKTDERKHGRVVWLCSCDCGGTKKVTTKSLTTGVTKSCGCLRKLDLRGKIFGKLRVIESTGELNKRGVQIWRCVCECGNTSNVATNALTQKNGTRSCGCIHEKNLVGKIFGKLTVIKLVKDTKDNRRLWLCSCECGENHVVPTANLTTGVTTQCTNNIHRIRDLEGETVGSLTVVEPLEKRSHGSAIWKCTCICGNTVEIPSNHLVSQHTSSCGCSTVSKGERAIARELNKYKLEYKKEYTFPDLKSINPLRFDFAVFNDEGEVIGLIEFDGQQHFKPIEFFGGEDTFKKVTARDKIKNTYCIEKGIPLVRIRYNQLRDIKSIIEEEVLSW